jgi:raffinose/stachyose/melibiose transport system substrate-binding protein
MSKSRIMTVILTVLIATSVMAAGGKDKGAAAPASSSEKTTLSVLNYADFTNSNTAADQAKIWDDFAAQNPDIAVTREDLFNEPFHQKTEAYAASGNMPDVLYVWPSGRSTSLHQNKLLKDLTPFIQKDGLTSQYLPLCLDPKQQGGGYLAMIPQGITSSHAFYVNMEVLNDCGLQPAKTYAELKAQVPVLKAKGYETILMPNQDTWVMQSCLFSLVAGRFGGVDWEKKILSGQAKFTDPDFVKALDFIAQMYKDGVLAPSSLGLSYGDGPGQFAANKGAYYIDGDWRVGAFLTDKETGMAIIPADRQNNIKITVFPDIEGAKLNKSTSAVLGTGWAMSAAIPAGSAREAAAWKLLKYLVSKDILTIGVAGGGIPTPSRTDIDYSKISLEPMQVAIGNLGKEYNAATVVVDAVFHSDVYTPINDGLQELGLGGKTAQQVAEDTQKAFDAGRAEGKW